MTPILAQFISESRDLLETTGRGLLQLERHPDDSAVIDEVFRAVHTIKGASGLFDFHPMTRLVHAAEDLLDALRDHRLSYSAEIGDLLLATFDLVSLWIDVLETDEALPADAEEPSQALAVRLRALVPKDSDEEADLSSATASVPPVKSVAWLKDLPESQRVGFYLRTLGVDAEGRPDGEPSSPLFGVRYRPIRDAFFSGEDPLFVVCNAPGVVGRAIALTAPLPPPTELDPYQCSLDLRLVCDSERSALVEHFRYMAEAVEITPLHALDYVMPAGGPHEGPVYEDFLEEAPRWLEQNDLATLERAAQTLLELSNPDSWMASALRWLRCLLKTQPELPVLHVLLQAMATQQAPDWIPLQSHADEQTAADSAARASSTQGTVTLHKTREVSPAEWASFAALLQTQLAILAIPVEEECWRGRILSMSETVSNALRYVGLVDLVDEVAECRESALEHKSSETLVNLLGDILSDIAMHLPLEEDTAEESTSPINHKAEGGSAASAADGARREQLIPKVLKIDQARIDLLMDLIGELVVAKNALPYLANRAEQHFGVRELSREIKEQYSIVHRISQELQGAIMQVRMLPVSNIFQRFPRLVRDLSRKLNKRINLVVEGEETEADKNIIESLADPLIHILRNSIDHGIELPEQRKAAGKPEEGTIRIKAYPDNDRVIIDITDDGKGIDPQIVKLKAFEKGLLSEERLEAITDEEAIQLVLLPGFSTAAIVSDLSGRGVGMDVVRQAVNASGGSLRLSSTLGQGTQVKLSLPLSMTVTQVMGVTVAEQRFGVPIDVVSETVKINPRAINIIKHQETFVLREQVVPLVRLARLLDLHENHRAREELPVLVIRIGEELVGVIVDAFHEGIEIILKPMEGFLGKLHGFSGTALLGNGSVLLVLDLRTLVLGMQEYTRITALNTTT